MHGIAELTGEGERSPRAILLTSFGSGYHDFGGVNHGS